MEKFSQSFTNLARADLRSLVESRKEEGWRYVQTLAVNTEFGIELIYTFMLDGKMVNSVITGLAKGDTMPSITDLYLEAFVFENEIHDLFGVSFEGLAIDFGGHFYQVAQETPMTIISPEQKAAREKARKVAEAKANKQAASRASNAEFLADHPDAMAPKKSGKMASPSEESVEAKLAGMDPEKVARVKAAIAAKAKKAAQQEQQSSEASSAVSEGVSAGQDTTLDPELEAKLQGMDPEKAAKVRAAMAAKAAKQREASPEDAQATKAGE